MAGTDWKRVATYAMRSRSDYSISAAHWTKDYKGRTAFEVLNKILDERLLRGSTRESGFIKGDQTAVCFSETPITAMSRALSISLIANESEKLLKWAPYGLSFLKPTLYERFGGRPVLYLSDQECASLCPAGSPHLWRVVRFDQTNREEAIDFSHEREWRAPGDISLDGLIGEHRPAAIVRHAKEADEVRQKYMPDGGGERSIIRAVFCLMDLRMLG